MKYLNTPRLVADAAGTTVWRWDQGEPFGSNPANDDPDGNSVTFDLPLRLPGQRYDAETGLHYNFYREYDPGIGAYVQSDPMGLHGGLHTYAYVSRDPLRSSDFFGLARTCGTGKSEPFTPNFAFEECCGEHDDCYDDCVNKPSKDQCDNNFAKCVLQKCSKYWIAIRFACENAAVYFAEVVSRGGGGAYNEARKKCTTPATPSCKEKK